VNQAAKKEETLPATIHSGMALTPMDMLDRAITQGAGIEVLTKLMDLQERWEKNQGRKAFDEAMSAAKAEIPVIMKNRQVGFESKKAGSARTDYKHEDLAEIARTVDPVLGRHGLSYRFRTTSAPNEPISVTCIISHRLGHSEENTLSAGRDDSGNKNSIQQIGSTLTYLQRYTLKAALGLAASADDDGKSAGESEKLSDEQAEALEKLIIDTGGNIEKFCVFAKVEKLSDIYANRYDAAVAAVNQAAADRKKAKEAKAS
jgi:hypothetical protein